MEGAAARFEEQAGTELRLEISSFFLWPINSENSSRKRVAVNNVALPVREEVSKDSARLVTHFNSAGIQYILSCILSRYLANRRSVIPNDFVG